VSGVLRKLGLAALLLAAGCVRTEPPMTTLAPKSDLAAEIYRLFLEVTAWDAFIFLIVVVAFVLAIFVFSTRVGEAAPPSSVASDLGLEVAYTLGPAFIILMISIPTVSAIFRTQPPIAPAGSLHVTVIPHQWWWEFRYPESGIVTANELHIPVGRIIRAELKSADVIHSFWVPQLGGKRDVVPGQVNELTFDARVPGVYLGQCAEFCGLSHANMRFRVFVETPEQFAAWEADQKGAPMPSQQSSNAEVAAGARIFANSPCTACHHVAGVSHGYVGPDLSHFGARTTMAGGIMSNTPQHVAEWIRNPDALKPGAQMPALGLRGPELDELVAYLESLK